MVVYSPALVLIRIIFCNCSTEGICPVESKFEIFSKSRIIAARSLTPSAEHHIAPPTVTNPAINKIPTVTNPCLRISTSENPLIRDDTEPASPAFAIHASRMVKNKHHPHEIS